MGPMLFLLVPAVVIGLVSIASFAGGLQWWLDVLANFRAQYAVTLMVLGISIAASRYRKFGYGVLAVALANAVTVAPLFFGAPAEADVRFAPVRIMSFNLLASNDNYGGVIEYIRAVEPDIVLLHEASRPWEVAMESADLDYKVVRARSSNLIFGTLVLVPEGARVVSHGFAEAQPRAVEIHHTPEGWPSEMHVLSLHPLAPTSAERAGLRDAQLSFASSWAAQQGSFTVVAGDLNATPWSAAFGELLEGGGLTSAATGYGFGATFPATSLSILRVPIDHVLISEDLAARDFSVGPDLGSDHFVVVADVAPAGGTER